jgi:HAD superfamily hydrolase (TIGR01490 family)
MALLSPVLAAYALGWVRNDRAKEIVLKRFIVGKDLRELQEIGQRFANDKLPGLERQAGLEKFVWHKAQGHLCVLVSASLDIYLTPWAAKLGFDEVICSSLEVDAVGKITGKLKGGNCFGEEKVERIKKWLASQNCTAQYAYGDSKGDMPMLRYVTRGYMRQGRTFERI